jgi:glycosyltransferase involved in cell wall biosynthesis
VKAAESLADALLRRLRDAAMRARLGQAGLERVRRDFDSRSVNAKLADLYVAAAAASGTAAHGTASTV